MVMELACRFFEESLQARGGANARGYLGGRGLDPDIQRRFRLGYARSSRNALKEHLAAKGVSHDDMVATGLVVTGDDIPVSFDRFRDRVMFPITDFARPHRRVLAAAPSAEAQAKYPELAGDGALQEERPALQRLRGRARPSTLPGRWSWSRAMST